MLVGGVAIVSVVDASSFCFLEGRVLSSSLHCAYYHMILALANEQTSHQAEKTQHMLSLEHDCTDQAGGASVIAEPYRIGATKILSLGGSVGRIRLFAGLM